MLHSNIHSLEAKMNAINTRLTTLAVLLGTLSLPVLASSTTSEASLDGSSASVGSVSDSIDKSSTSSVKTVTAGDYKVIEVAKAPGRPGTLRMKLQPVADASDDNAFFLYVPEQALARNPVRAGQVVTARDRPYGTEFARADNGKAFFLALQDDWYRELQTKAVTL